MDRLRFTAEIHLPRLQMNSTRLVYCLQNGLPLDMDVYDMAEWCCLGPLTRISLENGSAPVAIPDFTRGAWDRVKGFRYAFK